MAVNHETVKTPVGRWQTEKGAEWPSMKTSENHTLRCRAVPSVSQRESRGTVLSSLSSSLAAVTVLCVFGVVTMTGCI